MGASNPRAIDANNINIPQANQVNPEFENFVNNEFNSKAVNGKLSKDKFNEALACLEYFKFKRLRNTPLGERLFSVFDTNRSQSIDQQTFVKSLKELLYDKEMRVLYTFKAINREGNNKISRKEFQDFFSESWIAAFRILGEKIQQQNSQVSLSKINSWAYKQLTKLNQSVDEIFNKISNNNYIDFISFKNWVIGTDIHSIEASYAGINHEVPVNLYHLEQN